MRWQVKQYLTGVEEWRRAPDFKMWLFWAFVGVSLGGCIARAVGL